ncbi:hypothetical protein [Arthrobacter sp. NicSoilC5]|uniref:hypothetical protein n=1 Tax=Arthrobacter sp. NicSoilC5 TaxID=2831000 RepID=UPI001CC69F77|nr:hypothetical protein [Arthrobacter sp. NicSoilC5]
MSTAESAADTAPAPAGAVFAAIDIGASSGRVMLGKETRPFLGRGSWRDGGLAD